MKAPVVLARGFQFARVSSLRAAQLVRGCTPRVAPGHTVGATARREVASGFVTASPRTDTPAR
jgi:hypothetical protein